MSKSLARAAAAAALLVVLSTPGAVIAQQAPASRAPVVALVDVGVILKEHPAFKSQLEQLDKQAEAIDMDFKNRREQIRKIAEQMQQYNVGSPEYKQLEEQGMKLELQLTADMNVKKKEHIEQQASILFNAYSDVANEVKFFAETHGITLVLRYASAEPNRDNPQEIQAYVHRQVVYHQPTVDITSYILESVKRRGGAPQAPPGAGANPAAMRPGVQPRRQ